MVRQHWSIENQSHWHLDVTLGGDSCRIRKHNAPVNMKLLRKIALQIVKRYSDKSSMKKRRFRASLNANYLTQLLIT